MKNDWSLLEAGTEMAAEQFEFPIFKPSLVKMALLDMPKVVADDSESSITVSEKNDFLLPLIKRRVL